MACESCAAWTGHSVCRLPPDPLAKRRVHRRLQPVLVNGAAGIVSRLPSGGPFSVMAYVIRNGKNVEIDVLVDSARIAALGLPLLDD